MILKIEDDLMWPWMTSMVIFLSIKKLSLHDVSNHRNFYQNQFINEYATKKKLKVRYRKTYVHNKFGSAMVKKEINDFEWPSNYTKDN